MIKYIYQNFEQQDYTTVTLLMLVDQLSLPVRLLSQVC